MTTSHADTIELTEEQKEIVTSHDVPLRVLAGPGTGKTLCLIEQVKWLIKEKKVSPKEITVITFTNAGAGELRNRLRKCGIRADNLPYVSTLHGLAMGILKRHQRKAGLRSDFRPIDSIFTRILLKDVAQELRQKGLDLDYHDIRMFQSAHLRERAGAGSTDYIVSDPKRKRILEKFSNSFHDHLDFYNALDWNDLLHKGIELIDKYDNIHNEVHEHTTYLLVDEYQDLCPLEQSFVDKITAKPNGLCVVGDDDQSIYETFRYAAPEGIINFHKKYTGTKSLYMTLCRRCPPVVIEHALALIKNNKQRAEKELKPFNKDKKGYVHAWRHRSKKTEIEWLIERVKKILEKYAPKDVMILFTDGDIAKDYVFALQKEKIPLDIQLKLSHIFETEHFMGLISAARWCVNNDDNFSFRHCLEYWKGIGPETARQLRMQSVSNETSLWKAARNVAKHLNAFKQIRQRKVVAAFSDFMESLLKSANPSEFMKIFFNKHPESKSDSGCEVFANYIEGYEESEDEMTLKELLENFEEKMNSGDLENASKEEPTGVRIMTMHSAKGCESPIVIMPALEDDIIPGATTNVEEKRRLFYVSATRSKVGLHLSWASQRSGQEIHTVPGRQMLDKKKSRFLEEMGK